MTSGAVAYSPVGRCAAAVLVVVSRVGAIAILAVLVFLPDVQLDNPLVLLRAFATFCLLPGGVAWLLGYASAARVEVGDEDVVIAQRRQHVAVPRASIARLVPWRIPLPKSGYTVRLRSGRALGYGLHLTDPRGALSALGDADAAHHPATAYAAERCAWRGPWYGSWLRFPVFALVPTLPLFRLHQWIAYGGTFGEYYTYGLGPYLLGFAIYWATTTVHLVLYATALRAVAEPIAIGLAWTAPASAGTVRRAVEWSIALLYYGGVPALLLLRFLQA